MKGTELTEGVYWVGAIDWAVRDFHGYVTPKGSTYNNYLILDDEVTLIDAVKYDFMDACLTNIRRLVEPSKIKHIVINHIEPDHASGLDRIMELAPKAIIYCTDKGKKGLVRFFPEAGEWDIRTVKTGDTLNIGKRSLLFIETPMLHWPDSMMTYLKEGGVLFSQDGFGQHMATAQRFNDEFIECASYAELEDAVWDYYANILMPFGTLIKRKIDEIRKLGIGIEMIAPDHGVIWRSDVGRVLEDYYGMATGRAEERVVIIYDTMWHNTERMVQPIMEGLRDEDMDVRVFKLRATPMSVATKEFWRARGCLIGSPTLNNTVFPEVGKFLVNLKGLRPKNRIAGAFGSYGWGGGAVKEIYEWLTKMGLEVVPDGAQSVYHTSPADLDACRSFGREFAKRTREYHKQFT